MTNPVEGRKVGCNSLIRSYSIMDSAVGFYPIGPGSIPGGSAAIWSNFDSRILP